MIFPHETLATKTCSIVRYNRLADRLMDDYVQAKEDASANPHPPPLGQNTADAGRGQPRNRVLSPEEHQRQTVRAAECAAEVEDTLRDFCDFVMAGRYTGEDGITRKVVINATYGLQAITRRTVDQIRVTRDVDSVIGVTWNLPFNGNNGLSVYPVPRFKDALVSNVHINATVTLRDGSRTRVPLHQIPNFAFLKIQQRHVTLICLPDGIEDMVPNKRMVPQETLSRFYNEVLMPVVRELLGAGQSSHWPHTYGAALEKYRDEAAQLRHGTVDIPGRRVESFGRRLRRKMNEHELFKNAFFVHQFRGYKGLTVIGEDDDDDEEEEEEEGERDVPEADGPRQRQRRERLREQFPDFEADRQPVLEEEEDEPDEPDELREERRRWRIPRPPPSPMEVIVSLFRPDVDLEKQWYFDIAREFHLPGYALLWKGTSAAHVGVLQHVMPDASPAQLRTLAHSDRYFWRDSSALLYEVAGYRATTGHINNNGEVRYVQIYLTEKNSTYQNTPGAFKHQKPDVLLSREGVKKMGKVASKVAHHYLRCGGTEGEEDEDEYVFPHESCARVEVRVRGLARAQRLVEEGAEVDADFAMSSFIRIPIQEWWNYKYYGMLAVAHVFTKAGETESRFASMFEHVLLRVFTLHMYNGLIFRQAQSGHGYRVVVGCMPHILVLGGPVANENGVHDENAQFMPDLGRGRLWLSGLAYEAEGWRVPPSRFTENLEETVAMVFKLPYFTDVQTRIRGRSVAVRLVGNRAGRRGDNRTANRVQGVHLEVYGEPTVDLNFGPVPIQRKPGIMPRGPDAEAYRKEVRQRAPELLPDNPEGAREVEVARKVSAILHAFPKDMLNHSPNRQRNDSPSYILWDSVQRSEATLEIFKTLDWSTLWHNVYVRVGHSGDLRVIFGRLFPRQEDCHDRGAGRQNYCNMTYYKEWCDIMLDLDESQCEAIRATIWRDHFSKLWWVPDAVQERVWQCRRKKSGLGFQTYQKTAPWLMVNRSNTGPGDIKKMIKTCATMTLD